MTSETFLIPRRLKCVVAVILFGGFSAAAAIYVNASLHPDDSSDYQFEDSKRYMRELELYGGKANVVARDFRLWFASLWHGRNLAFTVGFLTVLLALAVLFFGVPIPPATSPSPVSRGRPSDTPD